MWWPLQNWLIQIRFWALLEFLCCWQLKLSNGMGRQRLIYENSSLSCQKILLNCFIVLFFFFPFERITDSLVEQGLKVYFYDSPECCNAVNYWLLKGAVRGMWEILNLLRGFPWSWEMFHDKSFLKTAAWLQKVSDLRNLAFPETADVVRKTFSKLSCCSLLGNSCCSGSVWFRFVVSFLNYKQVFS